MKLKWFISTTAIAILIAVALLGLAGHDSIVAAQDQSSKIEGVLLDKFSTDETADFIVRFVDQADLSPAFSMDWNARGEFVYNTLKDTAAKSQVNAKAILDAAGLKYQTYIAGNDLYVWSGTLTNADAVAALPEVYFIRATRTYYIDPIEVTKPFQSIAWAGDLLSNHLQTTVDNAPAATTDWGITDTKADQFWAAYGVKGVGIKVANIDTGVQWDHPALVNQFACPGDPSNPNCWYDPSNVCGGSACDNQGHGSHTMGTMVAKDDPALPYIAGMAPDSTWIACKGCESNSCSDTALNACADWILAPGGNPANRPNVVNNSWGGGGGDTWYLAKVQAWVADGIFPAFSAGNNYSCSAMGSPGDYQESFASASHQSSRLISDFSSKGPSPFGDTPYTKPNISAPGSNICSTVPTNSWSCGYSGTSMASPHAAGAVALIWSCNPSYVGQIDATFQLLQNNADTPPSGSCGAPPDGEGNYTFGYGYLDVLQAGLFACGSLDFGSIDGYVLDQNSDPIEGASVSAVPGIEGNQIQATTDPTGYYTMTLPVGTYDLTASKVNYTTQTVTGVLVEVGVTTPQDFQLTFLGGWTQIPLPAGCPEFTRLDAKYFEATGKAYILGGRGGADGSQTFGDIYSFDPATQTCADTGTNMPTPISNYTIVPLNDGSADLLCTFGGRDTAGIMTNVVQCYDPLANAMVSKANLPAAFDTFLVGGATAFENKAYLFGGFRNTASPYNTNVTYVYDPLTDSYTASGNETMGRGYIDVAVVDGLIYAFGGDIYDGTNLVPQTIAEVYDPAVGTWNDAAVADMPDPTAEGRAFGFDTGSIYDQAGKVIIAGGGVWPADTNEVFSWDKASNTYDYGFPNLNTTRRNQGGFFVPGDPGAMWVFGGRSGADTPPYAPPEYYETVVTTPKPKISVTPTSLATELLADATTTLPITITNIGTLPLDWALTDDVAWLTEDPTSGTLQPAEAAVVDVTFDATGLTPGDYAGLLSFASNDPNNPVVEVPATLTVLPQADLSVIKTSSPDVIRAGDTMTYTLVVTNNGPDDATGVKVVDTLPADMTFVRASAGCALGSGKVTCSVGALAADGVVQLTIVVTADVEGTLTNVAAVSGNELDPDLANNEATLDTTVLPAIPPMVYIYLPLVMK
jgi:uncharacterized repeat protein (TIGR01451 family)